MKDSFILEVDYPYVLDDCVEVSIPYQKNITIIGEEGIIFHDSNDKTKTDMINNFLLDPRRTNLPYSNIPTYKSRFLFEKVNYTIQLLNYDSKYLLINPDSVIECYPVKVDDKALIAVKQLNYNKERVVYQSRKQIENIFKSNSPNEQFYAIYEDGTYSGNIYLPTEKVIINQARDNLKKDLNILVEDSINYLESKYEKSTPLIGLEKHLSKINIDKMLLKDTKFMEDNVLCVKIHNGDMDIKEVSVRFEAANTYLLESYDVSVINYKLGQIIRDDNIIKEKDFKINPLFNRDIPRKEISTAKKLVKRLKKEKKG